MSCKCRPNRISLRAQRSCRHGNLCIDATKKLEFGTLVSGLFLEGARWDLEKGRLALQHPKVLTMAMPLVQIIPVEANRLKLHGTFRTPVYITPQRANAMQVGHVFSADLKSDVSFRTTNHYCYFQVGVLFAAFQQLNF